MEKDFDISVIIIRIQSWFPILRNEVDSLLRAGFIFLAVAQFTDLEVLAPNSRGFLPK